jgi:DNA-binding transcriptional LysR family regulator
MSRPLPPLNALRAFEAIARHLSFKQAAEELFVTPAALSHQIKDLEATLGQPLFERKMRSIALTPAGEALYPGLHVAFLQIRQSVEFIGKATDNNILVVSTPPGFTSKWLAPRLYRFLETNPDIDVRISATLSFANFTTDGVDIAIRNSRRSTQGLWARPLLPVSLVPVASPRFVAEKGLKTPADLANVPLLHDDMLGSPRGVPSWSDWLAAAGVAEACDSPAPITPSMRRWKGQECCWHTRFWLTTICEPGGWWRRSTCGSRPTTRFNLSAPKVTPHIRRSGLSSTGSLRRSSAWNNRQAFDRVFQRPTATVPDGFGSGHPYRREAGDRSPVRRPRQGNQRCRLIRH